MKILLVEDDPETAAFVKRGLTEAGHIVDHAAEREEALRRYRLLRANAR